jgi:uncharacterized membrane protein (Fun14 family)
MRIKFQELLVAVGAGALSGFAGICLHNAAKPVGAIVALLIIFTTFSLLGKAYHSRAIKAVAALAAMAMLIRASTHGVSFELLVYGNSMGNFYTVASTALLIYLVVRREWKSSVNSKF